VSNGHRSDQYGPLDLQNLNYKSVADMTYSDHIPVVADFELRVFPLNELPPTLIEFVYPNAASDSWLMNQSNVCQFRCAKNSPYETSAAKNSPYETSAFDWIGLFQPGFTSDSDAVTWMYLMSAWEDNDGNFNLNFKQRYLIKSGTFQMGFFSRSKNRLIALSKTFQIISGAVDLATEAILNEEL